MKYLLLVLLITACTHQMVKKDPVVVTLPPIEVSTPTKIILGTPNYVLGANAPEEYVQAVEILRAYANTDEFWQYVEENHSYFAHTSLSVKDAIKQFRADLNKGEKIEISFYTPWYKSAAIGSWDGERILENTQKIYTPFKRAGHLLHETSHKYGFKHDGNYSDRNDNQNSFPYVVGYALELYSFQRNNQLARK